MRNISDYFAKYRCVNVAMKLTSINKPATNSQQKVQIGNPITSFNRCDSSFSSVDYEQEFELSMRNPGGPSLC
jgi:hypothetical protein